MSKFDPNADYNKKKPYEGVPPGDYLLVIRDFKSGDRGIIHESKTGKPYLKPKIQVIAGAAKKKTFFDFMSLDLEKSGWRIGFALKAIGDYEPDLDTEDEESIRRTFIDKPFKARVRRQFEHGYTNNSIEKYLVDDDVSDADRRAMEEWVANLDAEREMNGGGSDFDSDVPPPDDTDIPF